MFKLSNLSCAIFYNCKQVTFVFLLICVYQFSGQAQAEGDLCIEKSDWVTGSPTLIDGDVLGDVGYTKATRAELGKTSSGVPYAGFIRIVEDLNGQFVWIGLEIEGIAGAITHPDDVVMMALSTGSGHDTYIQIRPFAAGPTSLGAPEVRVVKTRPAGGGWSDWAVVNPEPPWIRNDNNNIRRVKIETETESKWLLEMKIPMVTSAGDSIQDGIFFGDRVTDPSLSGTLKMYINVLRTTNAIDPMVVETPWPNTTRITDTDVPPDPVFGHYSLGQVPIPPVASWADVSLGNRDQCTGVSLNLQYVGTRNDPDSKMRLHKPGGSSLTPDMCNPIPPLQDGDVSVTNIFKARPKRTDVTVAASDITITYKIANWGIPGLEECDIGISDPACWNLVATSAGSITAGLEMAEEHTFDAPWQPTYEVSCNYVESPFNCMAVTMSSTNPDVKFINDSVRKNMQFVTTSRFEQSATISARGYGEPTNNSSKHRFLVAAKSQLEVYKNQDGKYFTRQEISRNEYLKKNYNDKNVSFGLSPGFQLPVSAQQGSYVEAMTWIAMAYLTKSTKIKIGETVYTFADEVGGFGYVASHDGMAADWSQEFTGEGLQATNDPNAFMLDIEPGGEAVVNTVIEANDYRFAINGKVGATSPHSTFSNDYDSDISFQLGLEYLFNNTYSIEGILGKHDFSGIAPVKDETITHFSVNGRYYLLSGGTRVFFNAGFGIYDIDTTGSAGGINVGAGADFRLARRLSLEAAYNYHDVNNTNPDPKFSTLQLGLRYLF